MAKNKKWLMHSPELKLNLMIKTVSQLSLQLLPVRKRKSKVQRLSLITLKWLKSVQHVKNKHVNTKSKKHYSKVKKACKGGEQVDDGFFWMEWSDFTTHFQNIDICHRSRTLRDVRLRLRVRGARGLRARHAVDA